MIALPIGLITLRTGLVVPRWAAWLALLLGIALLTPAMLVRPAFFVLYAMTVALFAALSLHLDRTERSSAGLSRRATSASPSLD
jgi:hypothetical protein